MSRLPLAACAAVGFGLGGSAVPAQAEHVYPKPGDRVYAHRITSLSGTVTGRFVARPDAPNDGWRPTYSPVGTTTIAFLSGTGSADLTLRRKNRYRFGAGDITMTPVATRTTIVDRSDGMHCEEQTRNEQGLRPPTPYTMRLAANGRRVHVSLPDRAETLPGNLDVGAFFCEPPQDFQYLRGGALRPRFVVPTSRFKRRRLELHLVTTEPFASPTWTGELRWDIRVRLRRYYPKPR